MKTQAHASFVFNICTSILVVLFSGGLVGACCKDCPPPKVVPPAVVEAPCELPPLPKLPTAKSVTACAPKLICYDMEGAVSIVERDSMLRQWVKEVHARCSRKPTSQPAEKPDAGSPDQ